MIKTIWRGYLYDGKRKPLVEVVNGQMIKVQGKGEGTCILKGYLAEDTIPVTIGLIRCSDLAARKRVETTHVYQADVSGYKYVSVEVNGFKSIYGVIYGNEEYIPDEEVENHEYSSIIILDTYTQMITIRKDGM